MRQPAMSRRTFVASSALAGLAKGSAEAAAATRISEEVFHGRRALVIQNDRMRVAVLPGGGFIADASLKSPEPHISVNPMRIPHYPTIDPDTYDPAKHGALYGTGIQRQLMSGYMGHFTCFPHFAASSPAEFRQDLGQHGELIAVRWRRVAGAAPDLVLAADLPLTHYAFERRIVLPPDETVAYVTETAENLERYDRPAQWVQHTAFGPPFAAVGRMFADASASVAGPNETIAPLSAAHRAFTGRTALWLTDQDAGMAWLAVYSTEFNVLLGYLFEARENPWLLDYQENMTVAETPWNRKVVMRGLCFGDSATAGLRNSVTQGSAYGRPTYGWFEARGRRAKRYAIFLAQIPSGFRGVASLRAQQGAITLIERETGGALSIKASRLW